MSTILAYIVLGFFAFVALVTLLDLLHDFETGTGISLVAVIILVGIGFLIGRNYHR